MIRYTPQASQTDTPKSADTLPKSVQAYLDNGAAEGGRNCALFAAATQMRDIGATQAVTAEVLTQRALADGLPVDEIERTLEHVFSVTPRQPPTGCNGTTYEGKRKGSALMNNVARNSSQAEKPANIAEARSVDLPAAMEDGFRKLIMAAFNEGEGICIAPTREHTDGTRTPETGTTLTREKWLEKIDRKGSISKVFTSKHGLYMRVNPLKEFSGGRNSDVTAFRHVLVEFDRDGEGNPIPKEKQYGALLDTGLPITAILDSGNKSVHAWVCVGAANLEEYKDRVEKVYSLFDAAALDKANRNPARLSRCPEGIRTVEGRQVTQNLLALNVGAESWEEWKNGQSDEGDTEAKDNRALEFTTALLGADELHDMEMPKRVRVLGAWMREGDMGYLFAERGAGKSWMAAFIANAVAEGKPLGEWSAGEMPRPVFYFDAEMNLPDVQTRYRQIGIRSGRFKLLSNDRLTLEQEHCVDIANPEHQQALSDMLPNGSLFIIDNLSTAQTGMKENDNDDFDKLKHWLLSLRRRCVTVLIVHHAGRNGLMRGSSRREDMAHWIISLKDDSERDGDVKCFVTAFEKCRNCQPLEAPPLRWTMKNEGEQLLLSCEVHHGMDMMLALIRDGVTSATDLAFEMKVSVGQVSKIAKKLMAAGRLKKKGREYVLTDASATLQAPKATGYVVPGKRKKPGSGGENSIPGVDVEAVAVD